MAEAVKTRYRLKGDKRHTTCIVTIMQYENFKILPIMEECKIMQTGLQIFGGKIEEADQALSDAIKKDTK